MHDTFRQERLQEPVSDQKDTSRPLLITQSTKTTSYIWHMGGSEDCRKGDKQEDKMDERSYRHKERGGKLSAKRRQGTISTAGAIMNRFLTSEIPESRDHHY